MEFTSRHLRAFHLVAHHLSFARAAEAVFITPSGLSVSIRELERQLGFRLFDRTTRQVGLTPRGRELLEITRPALAALDEAVSRIERAEQMKARRITVGTTPWVAANVLPPAIKAFRELQPELRIGIFDGNIGVIARRVEAGKLDLGLGIFKKTPGVRRVPFFRFSLMVIRADNDGIHNRVSTRWSALNGETLISLTANYPHQQLIDKQLAKAGTACIRGQTVNFLDTQIGLVEAEQGIAIIPSFGLPACRNRKVTMSELVDPVVTLEFYEISSRGRKLPAEASEFSAFLKMYIARWAGEAGAL
ncbi:MAG TPA: LysR family transcriptional regulator [Terriglobales bacterium]|jgi:LysR family transcriptional regulator, carnitine catabolism transcriptional activator|nr:LysR family transcriptional regulator [Terriglobales bacterium]